MVLKNYYDIPLHEEEVDCLEKLEEMLREKIPDISNQNLAPFGLIHTNYHVTELRLTRSFFHQDYKLTELPEEISQLTELTTLDISHNLIRTLPRSISELVELENFYADFNRFETIPHAVHELTRLRQLNFDENKLHTIPSILADLTYLQSVQLSGNYFEEIPPILLEFDYLRRLLLMRNRIEQIPYEVLDELLNLYVLDLKGNNIPDKEITCIKAYIRLQGKKKPKFRLNGNVHPIEDPFSLRNITKKMESEPRSLPNNPSFKEYIRIYLSQYQD